MPAERARPSATRLAVCAAAVSLLAACTSTVEGTGSRATPAGSSATTPSAIAASLEKIAIKKSDLGAGGQAGLTPGGDEVQGEVTLDNCGFVFTSEAFRVARRQYLLVDPAAPDLQLSNELVAYDTAAHARTALAQWHRAAATCPHTPVHSSVQGVPDLTVKITRNDLNTPALPVAHNAFTVETLRSEADGAEYAALTFQVRGRFLDGVYLTSPTRLTAAARATVTRLARITGRRLAHLR